MNKTSKVRTPLLPHQQRVVDKIQEKDRSGLVVAHGLGSGKTFTSIAAQEALGTPSTVVVPASLQENYRKERAKHLSGSSSPADIVSLQGQARKGNEIRSNPLLIVDEAHRLRDPATQGFKTVRDAKGSDKRLLLTATPFYNAPSDIAPLVNIAAGSRAMPVEKTEFDRRYISMIKERPGLWGRIVRGETGGEIPQVNRKMVPELKQIFEKYVDYHPNSRENFPSVTREDVRVPMTRSQMRVYEALMDEAPPWVAAKVRSGLPPSKAESKQLNAFLGAVRQVSNTTRAHQPKSEAQEPKIQRAVEDLKQLLDSNPAAKGVMYSNYLDTGVNPIKEHLERAGISFGEFTGKMKKRDRDEMVRQYNEGKLRALLLSSAGGEGLDLKGTRLMQVLEPHWNVEKIRQVEGRGVRFGSHADLPEDQRNVSIRRYLATRPEMGLLERIGAKEPGMSVDEYLAQRSAEKAQLNRQFKELLPGYVKKAELAEDGKHRLQGRINYRGLDIAVENRKGSIRSGVGKDGKKWRTVMKAPYGYIDGSKGKDGEGVDVYVGPAKNVPIAYVVHQRKENGRGHDEDKVIVGVPSEAGAKKLYLEHYDDPKFLGPISKVPVEEIRQRVEAGEKMDKIEKTAHERLFDDKLDAMLAASFLYKRGSFDTPEAAARARALTPASNAAIAHRNTVTRPNDIAQFGRDYPDIMQHMRSSPLAAHMGDSGMYQNFMKSHGQLGHSDYYQTAKHLGIGPKQDEMERMMAMLTAPAPAASGTKTPQVSQVPARPAPQAPSPAPVRPPVGNIAAAPKVPAPMAVKPVGVIAAKPVQSIGANLGKAVGGIAPKAIAKPGIIRKAVGTIARAV